MIMELSLLSATLGLAWPVNSVLQCMERGNFLMVFYSCLLQTFFSELVKLFVSLLAVTHLNSSKFLLNMELNNVCS